MDIINGLIVGTNLKNKLIEKAKNIANNSNYLYYPTIEITNYSDKSFIGRIGKLIYKGKNTSIVKLNLDTQYVLENNDIPWNIKPTYIIKNDCFKIINS